MSDAPKLHDAPATASREASVREHAPVPDAGSHDAVVGRTITIDRSRDELYAFWRDFANLPRFMENVESVRVIDERRSHWAVKAPGGQTVEWDAEIVEDEPGRTIAWRSLEGADIRNSGRVDFRDAAPGRGTAVTATIAYSAPGGAIGRLLAKLLAREPETQARRELRRLKQLIETGEISTSRPPEAAPRA